MSEHERAVELVYRGGGLDSAGGERVLDRLSPEARQEVVRHIRQSEQDDRDDNYMRWRREVDREK